MELLIKAGAFYNLLLIIFHLMFWRIFGWETDLRSLSFLNRAIMPVLNLSLTFVFVIFAYLSFAHSGELLETALGHSLLLLMAGFWMFRALLQPVFFKLNHWGSVAFMLFFCCGAILYGIPALSVL